MTYTISRRGEKHDILFTLSPKASFGVTFLPEQQDAARKILIEEIGNERLVDEALEQALG